MRYKIVPPARSVQFLREAAATLPLVPGSVEDCCSRIRDETVVQSRDEARECLTLLEALGLAEETARGYHRVRERPADDVLAERFRERVVGAEALLAAMAESAADGREGLTAEAAFDVLAEEVPGWERQRHDDWEAVWRERTERLLEWLVALDLAERDERGYHRVERG